MIKHLRFDDYQKMPWKNGQGFTFEIARQSIENSDDFAWRVSMADVEENGKFSFFENKKRIISVLTGNGIKLSFSEKETRQILARDIYSFSGEQAVNCQLLDGSIRDLNLIYSSEHIQAIMKWIEGSDQQTISSHASHVFVINMTAGYCIQIEEDSYDLNTFDSLHIHQENTQKNINLLSNSKYYLCLIELWIDHP